MRNFRTTSAFFLALVLITLGGCKTSKPDPMAPLTKDTKDVLKLNEESQLAVFRISTGWVGGFGEAVFVNGDKIVHINDLPIYMEEASTKKIMEKVTLPDCFEGTPLIRVRAQVHAKKTTSKNYSIPGAPEKTFYYLVVEDLKDVFLQTEPCK